MNKFSVIAIAALAAGLSLTSRDARALDGKTYAGLTCRAAPGSSGTYGTYFGTVTNTSSSSELSLICPVVHDTGDISSATIKVWDRHPSLAVECTLHFEGVSGSSVFGSDEDQASAS